MQQEIIANIAHFFDSENKLKVSKEQLVDAILEIQKEDSYLHKVETFMEAGSQLIKPVPSINIPINTKILRLNLILEELIELAEAMNMHAQMKALLQVGIVKLNQSTMFQNSELEQKIGMADALADLQYVLSGAIITFGYSEIFDEIFDEVQESNMSKFCTTEEEAIETVAKYASEDTETYYEKVSLLNDNLDSFWVIYRKSDKKILKSINYKPVELKKFFVE